MPRKAVRGAPSNVLTPEMRAKGLETRKKRFESGAPVTKRHMGGAYAPGDTAIHMALITKFVARQSMPLNRVLFSMLELSDAGKIPAISKARVETLYKRVQRELQRQYETVLPGMRAEMVIGLQNAIYRAHNGVRDEFSKKWILRPNLHAESKLRHQLADLLGMYPKADAPMVNVNVANNQIAGPFTNAPLGIQRYAMEHLAQLQSGEPANILEDNDGVVELVSEPQATART